ncbi:uncharacterized protein LOC106154266 [Lingula anatina]|uniref:Uncharacterized protein LOC106154266 n=1 Tax=Lingula anatina TaxID=7574 RepID=A0A1S3HDA5_LINAN|nr:uncharacterized protein LOC106154266 [Lingula anatina]|eukprot:XP_013384018.1 uncharacterized protein LOC106154266 [Lingula anatina]
MLAEAFGKYDHHLRSLTNDSQQQLQQNYFLLVRNSPQNPKPIGNFTEEGGFYLDKSELTIRTSSCASICTNCIQQVRRDYDFFVKEGDVYILALMKLHNRAKDPSDKYGCGEYDTVSNPYPQVEALLFALEEMSNKTGINFGAIVYDACDSSVRLTNMLGNFFNNETGDPHFALTVRGKPLDINKVVGCIGAFTSTDTLTAAAFLTHMKRILVSYSASSTLLDDRKRFPYFLRTLPSDSKQAKAIVDIIKHLKSNYVHLVHVDNDYGRTGASAFKDLAQENGICITQSTPKILDLDGGNAIGIAGQLLDSNDANIVVFFGEDDHAINFLSGLKQVTRDIMRQFVFIFSEAIADGEAEIRRQFPDLVLGSISLNVDNQHRWHTSFYNYLSKKTPDFSANPIWFNEFWEHNFQCSLKNSFSKDRSLCTGNERIAEASVMTGNPWVPPIITAALALTQGLSELQCLTPLSQCAVEDIVSSVAGTTLQSEQATSFRPFDDNGNGLIGYKIFSFQKNSSGTIYKEVGSISPNGSLVGLEGNVFYAKNGDVNSDFQSTCQGAVKGCDFCVVNDGEKEEGQEGLVTALVLVSVVLAVGLVAVAVFLYTRYKNDNCQVIARSCLVIHRPTSSSFKQNGVLHNETQSQTPIQTTTQDDADIDSIYTTPVSDNFNRLGLFFGLTSSSVDGSTRSADSDVGAANYGPPLPKRNSENGGRGRASTMPSRSISLPPKAMRSSADDSEVESEPAYLQMNRSEPGFPIKRQRPAARDPLSGLATLPRNNRNRHLQRNTPDRDSLEMYRHSESVHYHSSPLIDQSPPVSQQKSRPSDSEPVQYSTLSIPSTNAYTSPPRASAPRPTALYYPSSDRHHTSGESGSSGRLSPILPKPQGNAAVPSHYDPYPYSYVNNAYSPEPAPQGDDGSKSISSVIQYENPTPNLRRHAAGMIPNWLESQTDGLRSKYV